MSGSIVIGNRFAQYAVMTDSWTRQHYPYGEDVLLRTEVDAVVYEFLNGRCVAMVNGERYTPANERFHEQESRTQQGRARAHLLSMLYEAERKEASGNIQKILRRGLGVDDMLGRDA